MGRKGGNNCSLRGRDREGRETERERGVGRDKPVLSPVEGPRAVPGMIAVWSQNNGPITSTLTSPLLIAGASIFISSMR
jgi:hypothetical protein